MTIKELITELQQYPPDTTVKVMGYPDPEDSYSCFQPVDSVEYWERFNEVDITGATGYDD